jgi:hypothetical protein
LIQWHESAGQLARFQLKHSLRPGDCVHNGHGLPSQQSEVLLYGPLSLYDHELNP